MAVVGHSVALAITGVALGSAGALAAVRAMRSMVFGIGVVDPVVFGAIAVILVLTAALAALPPALRAASVDPLLTLR